MNNELLEKLKEWRGETAGNEGVATYRVLPNKTLENIAQAEPKNKEELLAIKGIREKKFGKYGQDILDLVNGKKITDSSPPEADQNDKEKKPHTVSGYLDLLNRSLRGQKAKIKGEISSLDIRERYLFFSIKDKDDGSLLNCIMWDSDYQLSGISFEEGMEIIIEGYPDVYKPNGRLTFKASSAELVGEGALKKAYEELRGKLKKEGLFDLERKKLIPEFSQKIGLITSETGAVIHDFLNNLGKYGYQIKFFNSKVEGQTAVRNLLSAINYFEDKNIDVLVIIRGGGSLESLQAFNNEILVRKIADFKKPVICGIGHDKDIPLVSMTADLMVSTPTAATVALNESWSKAIGNIEIFERDIIYNYQRILADKKHKIEIMSRELREKSEFIFKKFKDLKHRLMNKLMELNFTLKNTKENLNESLDSILINFKEWVIEIRRNLDRVENKLKIVDPKRQLNLGYSIVSIGEKIIKSVNQVSKGKKIDIRVSDGKIKSQVEEIINNK